MSKFYKILITLIVILIIEIILIYRGYKNPAANAPAHAYNPKKSITIVIDVVSNQMSVFQDGKVVKNYTVAGGKPSTPSPIGTWKVVNKDNWDGGFGGYWMGLNVPWGKYGIHGTLYPNSIGWNSSKGCIRMRNSDVAELYKMTTHGTVVTIWGGPFGNFGSSLRTLKPGDIGSDVYEIQKLLNEKGYYKANPDGIYRDGFKYAIHKYQKDNNLPINDVITYKFYQALGVYLME